MTEQIRILHVDDGPDFLALTKVQLEEKDAAFSVDTATTAREGLKLLGEYNYDAVLSDFQMPGMDGLKFLQHLRENGSGIPFIMFTGKGREEVAIAALNNGANHYIQKCEDIESLYETVAHVIRETVEQRRTAAKLAVIEKERQMVLDSVSAMIYHVDKDGNYIYVNKNLADACGLESDDFVGKSPRDIFPQYGTDYVKSDEEVVKSGIPKKEIAGIFQTSEGKKWIKNYKTPLKDAEGTVTGIIGLAVDITERKRMEKELKASEERSKLLLNRLPAILYTTDCDLRLTSALGSGTANTDLPPDQALGLTLKDILSLGYESNAGVAIDDHHRALRGESVNGEGVFNGRNLQVYVEPLRDAQGKIIGTLGLGIDITERKRAEDALRESQHRLRDIINFLPDATLAIDLDGKVIAWNRAIEELTGVKSEDMLGKGNYEYALPFYGTRRPILVDLVLHSDKDIETKYTWHSREEACRIAETVVYLRDREVYLWGKARTIYDERGNVIGAIESIRDITERKRAEAAQGELEERYRRLVELSFEGIAIHNGEKILSINPAGAELLGGTNPDQFIGKLVMDVVHPDYHEIVQERVRQQREEEQAVPLIEEKFIKLDGTAIDVEVMAIPLMYHGQPAMHVVFRDITERKKTEETLQESEKRFRDLNELLPQTVYELDMEGNIIYANQTGLKLFGYSKGDLKRGLTAFQVFIPEDYDRVVKTIQKVLRGQKLVVNEYTALRKDGTTFPVIIYGTPRMYDDKIVGVRGVVVDITERKRADKERERFLRELEAKNAEMERFTYSISHDLQSPLFSIRGFISLAREDLEQGTLENLKSDLKRVEGAAEKMDSLLNDTLQLSRIGRVTNPPEDVSFGTVVAGALEQVATQIKSSGTDVTLAKGFPTVHVDRERIEEILVNLIVNSIKYRDEQRNLKIEIGYRVEGEKTVFFVKDNGIGIDPSLHRRVFELFYQVNKRIKGTGAGLAIVKRIVEVHGGRIWIESESGKGCTVCFTLPVQ